MKNEKGVTLISLVVIIIMMIIMASIGIYTGISSYKVIDIQKFKSQLQMIQNEIDELYEKNKNDLVKGKEIEKYEHLKVSQIYDEGDTQRAQILKEFWDNIANSKFGIDTNNQKDKYYLFSATYIESEFGLTNIDISSYFIINLEKRLVFSTTPTQVEIDGEENPVDVYCLYQLDEEEKVIYLETKGEYSYSIIKEDYKQNIEIRHDINIEKIEIEIIESENIEEETTKTYVDLKERKDYCTKVSGLGTGKVNIEIIKDCKIKIIDTLGNEEIKEFSLYNTPILKNNMIPFIPTKVLNEEKGEEVLGGIMCYQNSPNWYDYNKRENIKFATAVIASTTSIENYIKNISNASKITFELNELEIKVWIPKNLSEELKNEYGYYDEGMWNENVTGIWVDAEYNEIVDEDGNIIKSEYIPIRYHE